MQGRVVMRCCDCGKFMYNGDKFFYMTYKQDGLTVRVPFCSEDCADKDKQKRINRLKKQIKDIEKMTPKKETVR